MMTNLAQRFKRHHDSHIHTVAEDQSIAEVLLHWP